MLRNFKVGDRVRFSVDSNGDPSWSMSTQRAPCVDKQEGIVLFANTETFSVKHTVGNEGWYRTWTWPQPSTMPEVYESIGYIELIPEALPENHQLEIPGLDTPPKACTCDLQTLMSVGCQCGGK